MHERDIGLAGDQLQQAIIMSSQTTSPDKTTHSPRKASWRNKQLSGLTVKTWRLFNVAKRTSQWNTYNRTLTCDKKEIRKTKLSSLRRYCQETTVVPGSARLLKIMAKEATKMVRTIKLPDGYYSQPRGGDCEIVIQSSLSRLSSDWCFKWWAGTAEPGSKQIHNEQGRLSSDQKCNQSVNQKLGGC